MSGLTVGFYFADEMIFFAGVFQTYKEIGHEVLMY